MSEEMIDIEIDPELAATLNKMSKKELIEKIILVTMKEKVSTLRCQTAIEDFDRQEKEFRKIQSKLADEKTKLEKSEAYVEQGRAMINAVMERWYEYDV